MIDGPPPPEPPEVISRDADGRATVRAVRVEEPLTVDGRLEEAIYRLSSPISGFIQQEPHEGELATEQTEVWILFDQENLYIGARCWDSRPEQMVANELRRDNMGIFRNDNLAVVLDPFYDRRNGFWFYTNPLGALNDGQVTDESDANRDWNTVWDVKTGRFPGGWTAEMEIPFKSLRYKEGGSPLWGINLRRVVRSKNEWSYLTLIPAAYGPRGAIKLSRAATLVGLEPPARSLNLEVKPFAKSAMVTAEASPDAFSNDLVADAGVDVKYGLTRSLIVDFTYNTDFAQVEDDEQQVNLTRFSLFFPEKREFFLEGQGIFAFGGREVGGSAGQFADTPIMFFSRRIGLSGSQEVPIELGGRLTGRAGKYTLGVLNIQAEELADQGVPSTNFSVFRIKRDILRRSNIGFIATHRSPSSGGGGTNSLFGLDANLSFYQSVNVNAYYARSRTPGLEGNDASYRGLFEYGGDRYGIQLERLVVQDRFNPEVGFLRRRDFEKSFAKIRFSPRPRSLRAIRKLSYEASIDYFTDGEGRLETREGKLGFRSEFENGDTFRVDYTRSFELLLQKFEIADAVALPVGHYHFQNMRYEFRFGPQRPVSGTLRFQHGGFFTGERIELGYSGRVELTRHISVEPDLSLNWVDLLEGQFITRLFRVRTNYTLSPRTSFSGLLQYASDADTLSSNLRFRWEYEPGSDLFIAYSDVRDTLTPGFPHLANRSFIIKFTRLFRF